MHKKITFLLFTSLVAVVHGAEDSTQPIVERGNASLSMADIDAKAATIDEDKRAGFFDSPERIESLLSNMLLSRQLANEARASGLDKDPQVVRRLQLAVDDVLARARIERLRLDQSDIDAEAIARETYQANPMQFAIPEKRVVRHILIETEKQGELAAREKLTKVEQALAKSGADFAAVAKQYSDDTITAPGGGLLPAFGRGVMATGFEDAAFALKKPGERSPVVQTQFGFHVIELVKIEPPSPQPYEKIREELVRRIRANHVSRVAQEHVDRLRNLPIEADEASIAALRTRFVNPPAAASAVTPSAETPVVEPELVDPK